MRKALGCAHTPLLITTRHKQAWVHKWPRFKRWQELEKEMKDDYEQKQRMKGFIRFPTGMYLTPERPEDVAPKKDLADMTRKETGAFPIDLHTNHTQMRYLDHSVDNVRRFKRYTHFQGLQYDQRMIPERLLFLGADLAAAHFLVHRGAAVKFLGDDLWYKRNKKGYSLPGRKVPGLYIEAIDASGTELMFEGFENLHDLKHLRMLRLANCEYVDDWVMSKIAGCMPELEMLDLSGCDRISAKGLMGLKNLKMLKYLRLEGLDAVKDLGQAALLLEESISNLKVLGVDYDEQMRRLEAETRLLAHPRVVQDAKGNAFAEDDSGRLFYISGAVNERSAVDDEDRPIMTSTIRREIPEMDDMEFEKLDRLSGGKLRHFLVGSPSGYSWTEQTEKILQHEMKLLDKKGVPVHPKMLPAEKRDKSTPLLDDEWQSILEQEKLNLEKQSFEPMGEDRHLAAGKRENSDL
ncbi:unnamed protein product, partial [Mesorhabditis spiculigera]